MAAKIRLTRRGSKKRPFYWIVVADSRSPRDGAFIEKLGTYDPIAKVEKSKLVTLDVERAKHWLSNGAEPSDRVEHFLDMFDVRKKRLRFTPTKGQPKEKARDRAEAKGVKRSATPIIEPLDEDERALAVGAIKALVA